MHLVTRLVPRSPASTIVTDTLTIAHGDGDVTGDTERCRHRWSGGVPDTALILLVVFGVSAVGIAGAGKQYSLGALVAVVREAND